MAVGAIVARILTQYSDKGSKAAQKDITKLGKQFDDFGKNAVRAFGIATAAVGAFAIKLGKDAVKGAMDDQKAQIALATALRNTVGANDAAIASTVKYLDKLELATGVNNDELIPSLQRLVTVTGDIATAQQLQQIALDTSAGTTKSLGTVTEAFARALGGNLTALKRLAPTLDATIVKNKDLAAAFQFLSDTYGGQAAARAETLEFRFLRLQFAFDQALDSLGYAFIPVLEDFIQTLTSDVIPKITKWVELNKKGLAEGLRSAAEAALELLRAAIKIGGWFVENFSTIKNFAILLASIWATGKIYSFITAIGKVSLAFKGMQAAALGAGAASAAATAGSAGAAATFLAGARALGIVGVGVTGITALTLGLSKISPRENAKRQAAAQRMAGATQAEQYNAKFRDMVARSQEGRAMGGDMDGLKALMDLLNQQQDKLNAGKKKQLSIEEKIIRNKLRELGLTLMTAKIEAKATAFSIGENIRRQGEIAANAPTVSLAAQGDGSSASNPISGSSNPVIAVNINTPYVTPDDVVVDITNQQRVLHRRTGDYMFNGRPTGMFAR